MHLSQHYAYYAKLMLTCICLQNRLRGYMMWEYLFCSMVPESTWQTFFDKLLKNMMLPKDANAVAAYLVVHK